MWEALGESIKIFVEKHFVPTIVSVVSAIAAILIVPNETAAIQKIGETLFAILIGGCVFLIVEFVAWLWKKVSRARSNKKYDKELNLEYEKKTIAKLWDNVDTLCPKDRAYLLKFLETGNEPIEISENAYFKDDSLMNSSWVVSTVAPLKDGPRYDGFDRVSTMIMMTNATKKYKLRDNIYELLKYSKDKYGKISNFDE